MVLDGVWERLVVKFHYLQNCVVCYGWRCHATRSGWRCYEAGFAGEGVAWGAGGGALPDRPAFVDAHKSTGLRGREVLAPRVCAS